MAENSPQISRPMRPGVVLVGVFQLVGLRLCRSLNGRRCPVAAGKAVFGDTKGFMAVVIYDERARYCLPKFEGGWFAFSLNLRMPRGTPATDDECITIRDVRQLQRVPPPDNPRAQCILGLGSVGEMVQELYTDRLMVSQHFETRFERDGKTEVKQHTFFWLLNTENGTALVESLKQRKGTMMEWHGRLSDVVVPSREGGSQMCAAAELVSVSPVDGNK